MFACSIKPSSVIKIKMIKNKSHKRKITKQPELTPTTELNWNSSPKERAGTSIKRPRNYLLTGGYSPAKRGQGNTPTHAEKLKLIYLD